MEESVFENIVSQKEEGEIMIIHTGIIGMNNTSFTRSLTPHSSSLSVRLSQLNGEETADGERMDDESTDVCWRHSAIVLRAVTASLQDCSFQNTSDGALSVEQDSILSLKHVAFLSESDDTPT